MSIAPCPPGVLRRSALLAAVLLALTLITFHPASAGLLHLISKAPNGSAAGGDSFSPSVSADGRYVTFSSYATNLVGGDTNGKADIFVHDRLEDQMHLVGRTHTGGQPDQNCDDPVISANGRYVVFTTSAANMVTGDTNGVSDVFLRDLETGQTSLISVNKDGGPADSYSYSPDISADGRYVVYHSYATNLVNGDSNGFADIFLRDRQAGVTYMVSLSYTGGHSNNTSQYPSISADGRYVAFQSEASNIINPASDTNGFRDVFVRDMNVSQTWLVSKSTGGAQGNGDSSQPKISADGNLVAFYSMADNLVGSDLNGHYDVFLHNRSTGATSLISKTPLGAAGNHDSAAAAISGDGRFVAYNSTASDLVEGDGNGKIDIFVYDRAVDRTGLVSRANDGSDSTEHSRRPFVSYTGRYVVFYTLANHLVGTDVNAFNDVYLCDRTPNTALSGKAMLLLP